MAKKNMTLLPPGNSIMGGGAIISRYTGIKFNVKSVILFRTNVMIKIIMNNVNVE